MSDEPIRLLIIDANGSERERYRGLLEQPEPNRYVVFEAESVEAGCRCCRIDRPHVVLLDCAASEIQGLESLPLLHAPEYGRPAVIMLASQGSEGIAADAMRIGARDYLPKRDLDPRTLHACIERAICSNRERTQELELLRQGRVNQEQLRVAGEIQRGMLPHEPPRLAGFDIAGMCLPAAETGGDFFDYIEAADGSLGVALGDVSGHGLGPAILASETRAYLRAFAQMNESPGQILVRANRLLCEDTEGIRFVTLVLARLRPGASEVCLAAAGHRVFLIQAEGGCQPIDSMQPPLGLMVNLISGLENSIPLQAGNLLLMMTDGISECCRGPRTGPGHLAMYGYDRAARLVADARRLPAAEILRRLFDSVCRFMGPTSQDDDMTAVVIRAVG
jgi:serine phosphatase RsbU (regulator of sigma subunit)